MIIPSIDIMGGQTVQLVGGEKHALDAGDPRPIATKFGRVGEIAVVDLDAAMGKGANTELIKDLLPLARCRVGGGIRSVESAIAWLDAGATQVVLGTAAKPEILKELPKERVIAALDAKNGEVVVEGWKTGTGRGIVERMHELRDYVGGFLVTFVEREGRLQGTNMDEVAALVEAAGDARLTIAGGVTTPHDVAELDRLGADAQVGMALYTGKFDLADATAAVLKTDRPDGLWPTVIVDTLGTALGMAYSDLPSLRTALDRGVGAYHSRKRGLWVKGESSGATQELVKIDLDCDRDTLRFTVKQTPPGFCHEETHTCWGDAEGILRAAQVLAERTKHAPAGSYTKRLLDDPKLLASKLTEEARELAEADTPEHVAAEAADVLYFTLVAMARAGVQLDDVARVLDKRALKVTRRPGNAK
jgi:phosphoribosyl-ATP pyrophosphohydrolase/phosphoribosyl-AMP cyclohydrolase